MARFRIVRSGTHVDEFYADFPPGKGDLITVHHEDRDTYPVDYRVLYVQHVYDSGSMSYRVIVD